MNNNQLDNIKIGILTEMQLIIILLLSLLKMEQI